MAARFHMESGCAKETKMAWATHVTAAAAEEEEEEEEEEEDAPMGADVKEK